MWVRGLKLEQQGNCLVAVTESHPVRVRGLKCGLKLEYVIHISSINAVVAPHDGECIEIKPNGHVDARLRLFNILTRF